MVINITGGNKTIRSLTKSLVEYCADKLKLNDTILLDIEFSRTLYKEDGILGEVDFDDNNHRPKEFTMTVDSTVSRLSLIHI